MYLKCNLFISGSEGFAKKECHSFKQFFLPLTTLPSQGLGRAIPTDSVQTSDHSTQQNDIEYTYIHTLHYIHTYITLHYITYIHTYIHICIITVYIHNDCTFPLFCLLPAKSSEQQTRRLRNLTHTTILNYFPSCDPHRNKLES